jgi:voltage-gated potassium channel
LATVFVWLAERNVLDSSYRTYPQALRSVIVLLFSGWDTDPPKTPIGFLSAFLTLLFGLIFAASLTAEVAAIWVEQRLKRSGEVRRVRCTGHIVVCHNSPHLSLLVGQLLNPQCPLRCPIVILADAAPEELIALPTVTFVKGDPTDDGDLRRAGVDTAAAAIILPTDFGDPPGSDARSLLTALAIEALNPDIYTVVEVLNPANAHHFAHAHVDEVISATDLGAKMAVQAALHPGLSRFVNSLLTFDENGEFYTGPLPPDCAGSPEDALRTLYDRHGCILIGVVRNGEMHLLPQCTERLSPGDTIIVLSIDPPPFAR